MKKYKEILEKFPNSEVTEYENWDELKLRIEGEKGNYKISGTEDRIKKEVDILTQKHYENQDR